MEIVGVEINGEEFLEPVGNTDSTGYYRAFMYYCINNYPNSIISQKLKTHFSRDGNDPLLGNAAIYNNRIECYRDVYFSTYSGNERKRSIIYKIAKLLDLEVFVHYDY